MPLDLFYGAWTFLCLAIFVSVFLPIYIIRIPYVCYWYYKAFPSMPYGCNPFCFTRYLYNTTYSGERKEDLKKTVLFSAAWQHYKSPFQFFYLAHGTAPVSSSA